MTTSSYYLDNDYQSDPTLAAFQAQQRLKRIRAIVDKRVAKSPLLQTQPPADVASLPRSAIHTDKVIGEGSFAEVLSVKRISSVKNCSQEQMALMQQLQAKAKQGRLVLKQIKAGVKNYCAATADLVVEAALLMRLSHPNLIGLHAVAPFEAGGTEGEFYLLLDRVDSTLGDEVCEWRCHKRSVPTVAQRVDYAAQLASVLEYLHSHGIVYRDLKLDNVGISKKQPGSNNSHNKMQLFDLGLTRQLPNFQANNIDNTSVTANNNDETGTSFHMSMAGTPRYMAPEVALEQPYNTQADVYSWAILVWECLSLRYAFHGYTSQEHLERVVEGHERPDNKAIPSSLAPLLERAWRDTPCERPDMSTVLTELETVVDEEKATTMRPFGLFRRRTSSTKSIRKGLVASSA